MDRLSRCTVAVLPSIGECGFDPIRSLHCNSEDNPIGCDALNQRNHLICIIDCVAHARRGEPKPKIVAIAKGDEMPSLGTSRGRHGELEFTVTAVQVFGP